MPFNCIPCGFSLHPYVYVYVDLQVEVSFSVTDNLIRWSVPNIFTGTYISIQEYVIRYDSMKCMMV